MQSQFALRAQYSTLLVIETDYDLINHIDSNLISPDVTCSCVDIKGPEIFSRGTVARYFRSFSSHKSEAQCHLALIRSEMLPCWLIEVSM